MLFRRADFPLVRSDDLADEPGFWPHYLGWAHDERQLMSMLEVDGADSDAMWERLRDPEQWPVLRVALAEGGHYAVYWRNIPGDLGVDIERLSAGRALTRVADLADGRPVGLLEWDDLLEIAATAPRRSGVLHPLRRLLLLLPLLGAAPEDAHLVVRKTFLPRHRADRLLLDAAVAIMQNWSHWEFTEDEHAEN
ncbi:hypothetical protein QEZ54_10500 [Catellatospora sp. KI3]|uniref:hypothetical protein n=1 Tax=Catellatospora sp. KI3 TaxID=3041620 RepID=UPI0024824846|nr:hypothetical protein [Catellatospora sp. KI3]MDI1461399.1 hypothetical protein [Catellatospora sp. KI3]